MDNYGGGRALYNYNSLLAHLCECLEGSDELRVFDLDVRQLSHTILPVHHHSAVPGGLLVATMLLGNQQLGLNL